MIFIWVEYFSAVRVHMSCAGYGEGETNWKFADIMSRKAERLLKEDVVGHTW